MRQHGEWLRWKYRKHAERKPPVVLLLDISGSMSRYSRAVLYFCHALMQSRERMHVFLFGTRLTNVTRRCASATPTRPSPSSPARCATGPAARASARRWRSSTASGHAARCPAAPRVLLVSDGIDLEHIDLLDAEMARLRRFAHRIIWLNPLLR